MAATLEDRLGPATAAAAGSAQAGRAAPQQALQRLAKTVKGRGGQLVEARADGTVQVLHALPAAAAVQPAARVMLKCRGVR